MGAYITIEPFGRSKKWTVAKQSIGGETYHPIAQCSAKAHANTIAEGLNAMEEVTRMGISMKGAIEKLQRVA